MRKLNAAINGEGNPGKRLKNKLRGNIRFQCVSQESGRDGAAEV